MSGNLLKELDKKGFKKDIDVAFADAIASITPESKITALIPSAAIAAASELSYMSKVWQRNVVKKKKAELRIALAKAKAKA
jgi:hypothetical protein